MLLNAALAKHAKALAEAHKDLISTALKISATAKEPEVVKNSLAISYNSYYQAMYSVQAFKMYTLYASKHESGSDDDETISLQK